MEEEKKEDLSGSQAKTSNDKTIVDRIRRLVEVELDSLEQMTLGLGEDGLKRLVQCALIMQRIRQPFVPHGTDKPTTEKIMQAAGGTIEDE